MTSSGYLSAAARHDSQTDLQSRAEASLPLVSSLVRRFPPGLYEPEELFQQGCIGLMKALIRFDPDHGTAFSTFAVPYILGEMKALGRLLSKVHIPRTERDMRNRIRKADLLLSSQLGRSPTVDELAASLRIPATDLAFLTDEIVVCSTDATSDSGTSLCDSIPDPDNWITRIELRDLLSRLSEADRKLLTLRYLEGYTQAETALHLSLTQVQVSRREAVLRRLLRKLWYDI